MSDVCEILAEVKVVPVIAIDSIEDAIPLADALLDGGIPAAEITFRTAAAADVINLLSKERPQLYVGAGTVLSPENAKRAYECGAKFAVAPGCNPTVISAAQKIGLPFAPGVMTPSDIEMATSMGLTFLKFFPAGAAGGVPMLKNISAPYKHLGVKFMPTGGVTIDNVQEYLAVPEIIAAGGTWLAKQDMIANGEWDKITENCKAVIKLLG
ncbi:MAG: bifunctional 4-hydroxy-2-oxoglutarate aldolase/2-dehydro-3-deoxy-phosphogluconate aldolase [Kiritimatiellae bacterium]|jgi:2-dehydro-3-deoxyphosphogluconate aldolase/(4S)-4-hydroxy-2-oxoglutarate aldolase|nr:bifunctional 4-hydroxy-2-oxoglutarate aldolase/2-dehydro-3-deoxy-phosphogluconate aldolase [Kiritimatiellia bacterium]